MIEKYERASGLFVIAIVGALSAVAGLVFGLIVGLIFN